MAVIEGILLEIGTEVVFRVIEVRAQQKLSSDGVADLLGRQGLSALDSRRAKRQFEMVSEEITAQLQQFIEIEARGVADNEIESMLYCVRDSFASSSLDLVGLLEKDLDAVSVEKMVLAQSRPILNRAALDSRAEFIFKIVVRECTNYLVDLVVSLPELQGHAFKELLKRETQMLEICRDILKRLPDFRAQDQSNIDSEFELKYRRAIARKLDDLQLFGVQLEEKSRRYPLTVAYISLSGSSDSEDSDDQVDDGKGPLEGNSIREKNAKSDNPHELEDSDRVESAVGRNQRLLVIGEAGSGKTTLLQWMAVGCARRSFTGTALAPLNDLVPIFIQLRKFVKNPLPVPEKFLNSALPILAADMPSGWVDRQLEQARALVLIDGLDEFPESQRHLFTDWLSEFQELYPDCRLVVTSRPGAIAGNWQERLGYAQSELLPMSANDISSFITHWYDAAVDQVTNQEDRVELREFENQLKSRVLATPSIRSLATSPLLCAMLCALNRDRKTQLPEDRMELYRISLETLLDRRDVERQIPSGEVRLTYQQKMVLLQDLALWMVEADQSDADIAAVEARFSVKLSVMRGLPNRPREIIKYLVLRSGVVREPSLGRIDFIHKTFQEYLAAKEIVIQERIPLLLARSSSDQWREIIILACGHASPNQRATLIMGLVALGEKNQDARHRVHLLAVACLETADLLDRKVENSVNRILRSLVPPQNVTDARALASAGELAVPLLAKSTRMTATVTAACVRALGLIGTPAAMDTLKGYGDDNRKTVAKELVRAWSSFPGSDFAEQVLMKCRSEVTIFNADQMEILPEFPLPGLVRFRPAYNVPIDLNRISQYPGRVALHLLWQEISDISALANLTGLELLDIEGCAGIVDFSALLGHPKLGWLDVGSTKFSDFKGLPPSLTIFLASRCNEITSLAGVERLDQLTFLRISSSNLVDLAGIERLGKLANLTLQANAEAVPNVEINEAVRGWVTLAAVSIDRWNWLNSTHRLSLANVHGTPPKWHSNIRHSNLISLNDCAWPMTDVVLPPSVNQLALGSMDAPDLSWLPKQVEYLNLRNCRGLETLAGIESVKGLKSLYIGENPDLATLDHLASLEGVNVHINEDVLARCPAVSLSSTSTLQKIRRTPRVVAAPG